MSALVKATVQIHLAYGEGWRTIDGWEVDVCGVPMVAHPSFLRGYGNDATVLSESKWSVTEPRTGSTIFDGTKHWALDPQTMEIAVEGAAAEVESLGGAEIVEAKIAERLADPDYGPPPAPVKAAS